MTNAHRMSDEYVTNTIVIVVVVFVSYYMYTYTSAPGDSLCFVSRLRPGEKRIRQRPNVMRAFLRISTVLCQGTGSIVIRV